MSTYRRIFNSTALIGGTQVIAILIGIVRTKALAVWLGTNGVGIAGLYTSVTGFIGTITGLGLGASGVRQIAEADATGDRTRLARTIKTLRVTALVSGLIGSLVVLVFHHPLSRTSFGTDRFADDLAVVSLTLLLGSVSAGQLALLQGLRRLKEMAVAQILGAALGTVASVAVVYVLRERGVAWFLVAISALSVLASWWYARKVHVERVAVRWRDFAVETRGLLTMGVAFMVSGVIATGMNYLTRVLVARDLGLDAVGLYQATWTLSSYYVGFVLNAMGADFCPGLTRVAGDNSVVNRMVNEQVEMGVLIALPGVLGTLVFAPWVLAIFYSKAFVAAAPVVQWQILGVFLRVVSWPLGMVLIAKGRGKLFICTETSFAAINLALLVSCLKLWGLEGVGIAFAALYVVVTIGIWMVCRRLSGFSWSRRSLKILTRSGMAVSLAFLATRCLPEPWGTLGGALLTVAVAWGCYAGLRQLLGIDPWEMVKNKLRLRRNGSDATGEVEASRQ